MAISTLLVISADPAFAAAMMARWHSQPVAFIAAGDGRSPEDVLSGCDLAICCEAPIDSLVAILRALESAGKPAICIARDAAAASKLRQAHTRAIIVLQQEGWFENLLCLAGELVRSVGREHACDNSHRDTQIHAALGRFMLDMRHRVNNALTSVLGNSELLLLDGKELSPTVREQLAVMHDMALRIHEVVQQFTVLEQEMKTASPSHSEIVLPPRTMLHATSQADPEDMIAHGSGVS